MSTSTIATGAASSTRAPWRELFLKHIGTMPQPLFVISTLHPAPSSDSGVGRTAPPAVTPRARTVVFRGMWCALPPDDRNTAPRNPRLYTSDLPVFTTDVRMAKAAELQGSSGGGGGGGGGGPVEAIWWCEKTGTQWRVRGNAWMLGPDVEQPGGQTAREALLPWMRRVDENGATPERKEGQDGEKEEEGWGWRREVTAYFGNLSPAMRGSFRNPPPGTPVAIPPDQGLGLGQKVDDLEDPVARANFRVVVIVPNEVDQTDLSDPVWHRRWLYTYRGASCKPTQHGAEVVSGWEKVEVWP